MTSDDDKRLAERFERIDWEGLDVAAIYAFYNAIGRPVHDRALLVCPVDPARREDWRRRCMADLDAFQKRSCPSCAA